MSSGTATSTRATRAVGVPVLLVIIFFGVVGPSPLFGFAFALVMLPSLVTRRRAHATRIGETLLCLVVALALGAAISSLVPRVPPSGTLKAGWAALAGGALGAVLVRFWLHAPRGGVGATLGVSLLALAFCGGVQSGLLFPTFVALFLVTSGWALRRADPTRAPARAWRRYVGATSLMLMFGALVGGGWALSLPNMHDWVVMQIMRRQRNTIGFSDRLRLGALDGLLESEKVVLRVHGGGVDHLRGVVYSHYYLGRWTLVQKDLASPKQFPTVPPIDAIEVELVDDDPRYYFTPMGAQDIALPSGIALVDRSTVIGPLASETSNRIWFRWDADNRSTAGPPDSGDLELTWRVMRALQPIAREWTAGARTAEQALALLEEGLQREAKYSLHVEPRADVDPIVDFVLRGKKGHCEYFASAMAVMARTLGIATRMVGGYRVVERNPWGGYWLVRERDAHTWIEAYIPGKGWKLYDPTPADEQAQLARNTTPVMMGVVDAFASAWSGFLAWLVQRSWLEVLTPLVTLVLLFLGVRIWRLRRQALTGPAVASLGFGQLSARLSAMGLERRSDETLHDYADRVVERLPPSVAVAIEAVLRRYAALRYGGVGEADEVERELVSLDERLRSEPPPKRR